MFTALMITLASFSADPSLGNTNEDVVRACVTQCHAYADKPSYELKACVAQCQELGQK
jgi:hypothetical protein